MPGKLKVAGLFYLSVLHSVVVYGDIVEGTPRAGDVLHVPLNSGLALTSLVRSVEAVDGTPTGSHTALVLETEDPEDANLLQGLNLKGDILELATP